MMKKIFLLFLSLSFVGCASYLKRKECESINWYEHGQKIALRGQWLNSDTMVQECRKVEAEMSESQLDQGFKSGMSKYCSAQGAYATGKAGDLFAREFCEGPGITALLSQYEQGNKDYCAKANGFAAGTSGKKYQNVCSLEMEKSFLPEYRRGRKKYVTAQIKNIESDLSNIEKRKSTVVFESQNIESQRRALESQRSFIQSQMNFAMSNNPAMVSAFQSQINTLDSDISSKRSMTYSKQNEINSLDQKIRGLNTELTAYKNELPSLD